jgi:UDP-N-acetyl-D-glucosamine dehydrogenase
MPAYVVGTAALTIPEPMTPIETLRVRILERTATIGIIGLGYVGLPLAIECGNTFTRTIGFDVDAERVEHLESGLSHIQDVPNDAIAALIGSQRLTSTTDFTKIHDCDAVVICVPTPLEKSKNPDLSYIKDATESIAANLRPGQMVILESTTYPGTTEELLLPIFLARGMVLDRDFYLAFSPERINPGGEMPMRSIPKVVGGCTERSTEVACEFYSAIVDVVHPVSSARTAETVKLLENTFRLVNIGLINEFAVLCNHLGIDSNEVIVAASTKPFGFLPFFPGPGAGGHCIPLDPLYLNWKAKEQGVVSRFIELADEINTKMPAYVVELVTAALNAELKSIRGSRILVIGVAYKDNVADIRQSPAISVIDRLRFNGAFVTYHDPLVPLLDFDLDGWPEWRPRIDVPVERRALRIVSRIGQPRRRRYDMLRSVLFDAATLESADCVLILCKHDDVDYAAIAEHARVVVDTRDGLTAELREDANATVTHL